MTKFAQKRWWWAVLLAPVLACGQVVTESFRDSTATGWTFSGVNFTPTLTSGSPDPAGDGWLRLTSTGLNQATSAYYNTAFAAANATVYASFEYQSWGGTGADGITFFLFDGSKTFAVGADGGSLGYAQKTGVDGLNGGYLGIAIDEFGNFSNPNEGRVGGIGFTPDAFAVRGPGTGTTGYDYLGGTGSLTTSIDTPSVGTRPTTFNQVQMLLSPTNQLTVTLQQGGTSPQTVLSLDLSGYARPDTLKYGFSSGTGAQTNYHEVRNLNVTTLVASLWDGGQGDSLWGSSNNWDPNILPSAGSDILLNNTFVSTAQTINTGTNRTVRSISLDAPFAYTLNNNTITFNAGGVPGFTGIAVSQTRGTGSHVINSALALANNITIRNGSSSPLALTGNISLGANRAAFDGMGNTTVSGIISGTGNLTKSESGTVALNAANTYTGGTTISGGTMSTNNNSGFGTGNITLAGGNLASTGSNTLANTVTLTGNSGVSNVTLSGSFTQSGANRTLSLTNATLSGNVALSNDGTGRTLTLDAGTGTSSTISGVISNGGAGAGGLTKSGAGTLVLAGANTYTGNTTVANGVLQLGSSDRISNSSNLVLAGGTLDLAGNSERVGNLTWSNSSEINFGNTGTSNFFLFQNVTTAPSGVLTISNWESGSDILGAQSTINATTLDQFYFVGYGSGATQGAATTVGTYGGGWLVINPNVTGWNTWDSGSGANSRWSTNTNWVGDVTPIWGNSTKIAFGTGNRTATDLNGSRTVNAIRFDEGSSSFTLGSVADGRTLTFDSPSASAIAFVQQKSASDQFISTQTVALAKNTVFDVEGAGNLTINSTLSGSGNLVKENTGGALILSGANTAYAGNIFVNAGVLRASSSGALGNLSGNTTVISGATLEVGPAGGLSISENITVSGTGVGGAGALRNIATSGTNTLSGNITLSGASTITAEAGGTLALTGNVASSTVLVGNTLVSTNSPLTLGGAGNISVSRGMDLGSGGVTINSTGTITYSGTANTYSGTTTVNSGTLLLSKAAGTNSISGNLVIGDGTGTDTVRLTAGNQIADTALVTVNSSGIFALNNNSETIARLDTAAGASVQLGTGNLTISGSGESTLGGNFTGTGSLIKGGTGKLSITSASAGFSGTVNLTSGIVNVAGSASNMLGTGNVLIGGTGNLELQSGATLNNALTLNSLGTGAIDGALQNIAGNNTVAGAVTLTGNSRIQSDSGRLSLTGNVALGANNLNVGGASNTLISGTVGGTGGITKDGVGDLRLNTATSYTGATTINAGTLTLGTNNVLTNSNVVSLGTLGTLNVNGFTDTIGSFNGSGSIDFGSAGTGALTISSGTSLFSGQFLGTGELIIGAGATFTLGADFTNTNLKITLAGGTLNLGGYEGTLGNLSVTSNSIIDFGTAPGGSTLDIQAISFASTGLQLSINNWTDGVDYFYSATSPGPQGSSPTNQIVFNSPTFTGNQTRWQPFDQQITPVPEPSTYGALLLASGLAFFGWRRWRGGRR